VHVNVYRWKHLVEILDCGTSVDPVSCQVVDSGGMSVVSYPELVERIVETRDAGSTDYYLMTKLRHIYPHIAIALGQPIATRQM
jgi:hypothetical protein